MELTDSADSHWNSNDFGCCFYDGQSQRSNVLHIRSLFRVGCCDWLNMLNHKSMVSSRIPQCLRTIYGLQLQRSNVLNLRSSSRIRFFDWLNMLYHQSIESSWNPLIYPEIPQILRVNRWQGITKIEYVKSSIFILYSVFWLIEYIKSSVNWKLMDSTDLHGYSTDFES